MAIQLKKENPSGDGNNEESKVSDEAAKESTPKFGYDDDTPDFLRDGVDTLPAYKDVVAMHSDKGAGVNDKKRSVIYKSVAVVIALVVAFFAYKGIAYLLVSSGKDISDVLDKPEEEIASELGVTFKDDNTDIKKIPKYARGKLTLRSDGELNIVYIDGRQIGVNTSSRKYKFFGIGINEPQQRIDDEITFKYEDCMTVLTDLMGGSTRTYFYRNTKENQCLAVVVQESTNRVVGMTFYTNYRKATELLESLGDEED